MQIQTGAANTREHDRRTVLVEARIMEDGEWHDCRIVNISVGGAKLLTGRQLGQGTAVRLHIGHFGQFGATVAWQHGGEIGVRFTHDPVEMADLVMGLAVYG